MKFVSRGSGYTVLLMATEAVVSPSTHAQAHIRLLGANPAPQVEGLQKLPSTSNYFLGNDPAKWRTHVPNYARVRYRNVYPGVDLVYYGNQQQIEHDFVVAPGAHPRRIRFAFPDASKLELDNRGDLVIHIAAAEMRLRRPVIYQQDGTTRREVAGGYRLVAARYAGFALGPYDTTKPLIIDPVLEYSTYLGGSGTEASLLLTVDGAGSAYVAGQTTSTDFPLANSQQVQSAGGIDGFIAKLSTDGALAFSIYLGGQGDDVARGIKVDSTGNIYVAGRTTSTDFPITSNAWQRAFGGGPADAFLTKLSADGAKLLYSTYLGGSGADLASDLQVSRQGNVYVIGATSSLNFPTVAAFQAQLGGNFDAFAANLNADGSVLFSTYLGGAGEDRGFTSALDASGNVYLVGRTASVDFPTANAFQRTFGGGAYDGYVAKLSPDGRLLYSTYIGGKGDDETSEIALDTAGNLYITGATNSPDFPTMNAFQPALAGGTCSSPPRACYDAFVSKLKPDGSALIYSTYLGGTGDDNTISGAGALAVDALGNAHVAGFTTSPDFPVLDALQPGLHPGVCGTPPLPCEDGFVAELDANGSALIYSTYLGGSGNDEIWDLKLDGAGNAYVFGQTSSTDFPLANPLQMNYGGGAWDAFVAKVGPVSRAVAVSSATMTAPLAPESLASLLGLSLAQAAAAADLQSSLPTILGGTSVRMRDSSGVERLVPLLYVSPKQINFQVPAGTATGGATLEVINPQSTQVPIAVGVRNVAPGLFTLKNNMAAAYAVRIEADGTQTVLPFNAPIVLDSRAVYLSLFGTGIRTRSSLDKVTCTVGGTTVPVLYAGPGGGVPGLDQVNILLPAALKGNNDGRLILGVDGIAANVVIVDVR